VQQLLGYLPLLACPVGMGLMMWMMTRTGSGQRSSQPSPAAHMTPKQQGELQRLRAELDEIRAADGQHGDVAPLTTGTPADRLRVQPGRS
jgi:hypothetical protein